MKGLLIALVLGGCGLMNSDSALAAYIERVQLFTVSTCKYLPTYQTIYAIFAEKDYEPSQYQQLAQAICDSEFAQDKDKKRPIIGKIPIVGRFL